MAARYCFAPATGVPLVHEQARFQDPLCRRRHDGGTLCEKPIHKAVSGVQEALPRLDLVSHGLRLLQTWPYPWDGRCIMHALHPRPLSGQRLRYFTADATPLFLIVLDEYVRATGVDQYVRTPGCRQAFVLTRDLGGGASEPG